MHGVLPDSLRRALEEVFARPEYRWVDGGGVSLGDWAINKWYRLQDWLDHLAVQSPGVFKLVLAGLIALLVALLVHVGYIVVQVLRPSPSPAPEGPRPEGVADARARRARAEQLAAAGRYVEALGHRFLATLLELEQVRALTVHPAKTPAEYVGEARLDPAGRASLQALVRRLYRHLFGAEPCDERAYREFGAAAEDVVRHAAPG